MADSQLGQRTAMLNPTIVFQTVNQLPDWALEKCSCTGRGKRGRPIDAVAAEVVFPNIRIKRYAALLAQGRTNNSAGIKAMTAEVQITGAGDETLAEMAARREEDIQECLQHSQSHVFIHHKHA